MRIAPLCRTAVSLFVLALLAAGCSADPTGIETALTAATVEPSQPPETTAPTEPTSATSTASPTETPDPVPTASAQPPPSTEVDELLPQVGHRNLAEARAVLDHARETWAAQGPPHYVMRVAEGCECANFTADFVVIDEEPLTHYVITESLPPDSLRSMENVHAVASSMVRRLEEDPSLMPQGECDGAPFWIEFDTVTGAITGLSDNTPCDGGITWSVTTQAIGRDGHDPAPVDLGGFNPALEPADLLDPVVDLSLGNATGFVIQVETGFGRSDDDRTIERNVLGEPCEFAAERDVCEAQIEGQLIDAEPLAVRSCVNCPADRVYVVAGRLNGGPIALESANDLKGQTRTIESAAAATLAAGFFGPMRASDDGWLVARTDVIADCDPIVTRHSTHLVRPERGFVQEADSWFGIEWGACI